tara:strand:+ start:756 stop:2069 length:1314 start_codon:yes stop_codon:yes gene_type:complete
MSFLEQFSASFLNEIAEGIDTRTEKAEAYEEEQKKLAERNAAIINTRNLRAQEAALIGQKAIQLGARKEHVKAAMASGMKGVAELYDKLQTAANQKGVKTLGEDDIEAIINMPSLPSVNQRYVDMSLRDFANMTYGVKPMDDRPEVETSDSVVRKLLGFEDMNLAKQRLQDTEYVEGMSIADINEAARQAEYTSLFPDIGFTLMEVNFYGPDAAGEFVKDFTETATKATTGKVAETFIQAQVSAAIDKAQRSGSPLTPDEIAEIQKGAEQFLAQQAVLPLIETTAGMYGKGGFFKHNTTIDLIEKTMGADFLADYMEVYNIDQDDEEEVTPETATEPDTEEATEEKEDDTETKEEEVSAEEARFSNVSYRNDEGKVINGVPPRPTREFSNLFFGQGMGGADIEAILKGEMLVPKYLRPAQWDELFGEFYNPDGTFKG